MNACSMLSLVLDQVLVLFFPHLNRLDIWNECRQTQTKYLDAHNPHNKINGLTIP